jgi:hypothetical protein
VARLGGLLALAAAGLTAVSTAASAATAGAPVIPPSFGSSAPRSFGPADSTTHTLGFPFACDLSGYGGSTSAAQTAWFSTPRTVTADDPATLTFTTTAVPLPSAVAQKLASATSYELKLSGVSAADGSGSAVKIISYPGVRSASTTTPAQIPAITATDSMTFRVAGTARVSEPTGFVITPSAGDAPMVPIKCYNPSGGIVDQAINVTAPPPTITGPVYNCSVGISGMTGGSGPLALPMPMTISATGARTTGSTDTVTLSSDGAGLGGPYPPGTTALAFSGSLPVTGAQHGSVQLHRYTTDVKSSSFRVSGPLYLTRPGTDHILLPGQFTFTLFGPKNPVSGTPVSIDLTCTSQAPTEALSLKVTGQPTPTASATGAAGGTAASGAVPAGAPNTGGGPRPGSGLPMAIGGGALLLIGAGFVVGAARRRRGQGVS